MVKQESSTASWPVEGFKSSQLAPTNGYYCMEPLTSEAASHSYVWLLQCLMLWGRGSGALACSPSWWRRGAHTEFKANGPICARVEVLLLQAVPMESNLILCGPRWPVPRAWRQIRLLCPSLATKGGMCSNFQGIEPAMSILMYRLVELCLEALASPVHRMALVRHGSGCLSAVSSITRRDSSQRKQRQVTP
jgi:hypothetical protein